MQHRRRRCPRPLLLLLHWRWLLMQRWRLLVVHLWWWLVVVHLWWWLLVMHLWWRLVVQRRRPGLHM